MKEYPYWWDTVSQSAGSGPQAAGGGPQAAGGSRRSELLEGRRFDVAIVGAGYTGLSAARQLGRAGASVVVLERDRIGSGASSRNAGQVLTGLKLDPATLLARVGAARARELFAVSLESVAALERVIADERIACEYERTGHLEAAWKPSHFEALRAEQELLWRVFNHRVALVPAAEQHTELGSDVYHGLLIDERSAALNPAQYVAGLSAAALRSGAVISEGAAVQRLRRQSARWTIDTSLGQIDAGDALIATNGYTGRATPALQRRFVPLASYMIATEPLSEAVATALLRKRRMAFDSKHFLFYFRVTRDRRLLFGGRARFTRATPDSTRQAAAVLRRGLTTVFPQLASARVEYAWGGNVAFTRDEMPHAGRLNNMYFAGGYCGHGIAMATYLGALIARRMAGEPIEHPLMDDRFPVIPLYRGTPWFLPLVGAYYKTKDWLA